MSSVNFPDGFRAYNRAGMACSPTSLTLRIARLASQAAPHGVLPPGILLRAKHSIADWLACALAGARHEDALRLRACTESWTAEGACTVLGTRRRAAAPAAALMNAFSGHVLDCDDVNLCSSVHATAAVLPAAWALAESRKATGAKLLDAYIAGMDAVCRLGRLGGARHYESGWHASAVLGVFGSGVACGAILGLDTRAAQSMAGLALAQASGVQSVFGTPGKPLQLARAAEAGLHAAQLASAGFTGHADVLDRARSLPELFSFEAPELGKLEPGFSLADTLLKFHASCFGTHAPLEAVRELQAQGLTAANLGSLELALAPVTANVCAIAAPATGTEIKFSAAHVCAMRLAGIDTGAVEAYTDPAARDPELRALASRIRIAPRPELRAGETLAAAVLADGRRLACRIDMGAAEPDLARQARRLEAKFAALASPVVGERSAEALFQAISRLEEAPDVGDILAPIR